MVKGQEEFENMPERTALGLKAIEYLRKKEEIKEKEAARDVVKAELVKLFLKGGVKTIKVEGYTIGYSHQEKDSITVTESKE